MGKVRKIASYPLALQNLRVCTDIIPEYNCGKCEKCLRTMIALEIVGALGSCSTLPQAIDLDRLRKMPLRAGYTLTEVFESLGDNEKEGEIKAALREALDNGRSVYRLT